MTKGNDTLYFTYDAKGLPTSFSHNAINYAYIYNLQGDVVGIADESGRIVVEYLYDAFGKQISIQGITNELLSIAQINPYRYRRYVYDEESGFYYVTSRYFNPELGRFINADAFPSTGKGIIGNNMFAYCGNNPIARADNGGYFWDTILDVVSLCFSIVDVVSNPTDVTAWIGLAGDTVDLIPFVSGVGELTRTATTALDVVDNVHDASRLIDSTGDIVDTAGDVARKTDFYITPNGEAIPATLDGFNDNLSKLDCRNGKYIGTDSKGPIRIRPNEIHGDKIDFKGTPSPFHTVPHFHIDRKLKGQTGEWVEDFVGTMEVFR